jgi:topoisomerase IA-like protein
LTNRILIFNVPPDVSEGNETSTLEDPNDRLRSTQGINGSDNSVVLRDHLPNGGGEVSMAAAKKAVAKKAAPKKAAKKAAPKKAAKKAAKKKAGK